MNNCCPSACLIKTVYVTLTDPKFSSSLISYLQLQILHYFTVMFSILISSFHDTFLLLPSTLLPPPSFSFFLFYLTLLRILSSSILTSPHLLPHLHLHITDLNTDLVVNTVLPKGLKQMESRMPAEEKDALAYYYLLKVRGD